MVISEVVAKLLDVLEAHGDLEVCHHDDWDDWVVETVAYVPAYVAPEGPEWREPAHVLLTGYLRRRDGRGGFGTDE